MPESLFMIIMLALLAVVLGVGVLFLLGIVGMALTPVPFVPSQRRTIMRAEELLGIGPRSVVYDLGCGNGRAVYYFADKHKDARIIGYELAPLPYILAQSIAFVKKRENAHIHFKNFDRVSLHDATHIYLYLFPEVVAKLEDKIAREVQLGTRVVLCDFPFPTRTADEKVKVGEGFTSHTLYSYTF